VTQRLINSLVHLPTLGSRSELYLSMFPIPVPRGANLAWDGRVVQELLRRDPLFREYISDPVTHKACATGTYFWPEIIVREKGESLLRIPKIQSNHRDAGGWSNGECLLNRTLLAEILKNM